MYLLLTKPEAVNNGCKCFEEGESSQSDWQLCFCGDDKVIDDGDHVYEANITKKKTVTAQSSL